MKRGIKKLSSSNIKKILKELKNHKFMSGVKRDDSRINVTHELFTPTELVMDILKNMDINSFGPGETVLDPTCGDGQFLDAIKWIKVYQFGMTEADALKDIYGVDIMKDNVNKCIKRLGGGNIITGNTLKPNDKVPGQDIREHTLMRKWFGKPLGNTLQILIDNANKG